MLKRSLRLRRAFIGAVAFIASVGLVWTARAQGPATRNVTLTADQISRGADGRLVIAVSAAGDLRGALTLTITGTSSTGEITSGEWVLVNTYIEDVFGDGHSAGDGHDEEYPGHHAGERLVQLGSLSGAIKGGTLLFDSGRVSALRFVQLEVALGSLSFAGVRDGAGTLALSGLDDVATSSGNAALTF
jgi:hypothetical protein